MSGNFTAAFRKNQVNFMPPNCIVLFSRPQHSMLDPPAPRKGGPLGSAVDENGITEYAAPVSTRYCCPVCLSST